MVVIPKEEIVHKPLDIVERVGEIGIRPNRPAPVVGVARPDSPAYRAGGFRSFNLVTEVRGRRSRPSSTSTTCCATTTATDPVTYLRPVDVPRGLGGLANFAVYESGVAALTPEATPGDLLMRTGLEPGGPLRRPRPRGLRRVAGRAAAGRPHRRGRPGRGRRLVGGGRAPHGRAGVPHTLTWMRAGLRKSGTVQLRREDYLDEYGQHRPRFFLRMANWAPSVPEPYVESPSRVAYAWSGALEETYDVVRFIVVGIVRVFEGKVSISTLGGPITVYDVVGEEGQKGVSYFVWAMALISINLGLVNLLPIPVLDGGHLLFFFFEALLRRPLPLRVRGIASLAGLLILVALMGIAFKNDVERRWDVIQGQLKELVD